MRRMGANGSGSVVQIDTKRQDGRFYTCRSPFSHDEFHAWARRAGLPQATLIEPFAGAGDIVRMVSDEGFVSNVAAFDLQPACDWIEQRDTFSDYPSVSGVVVTNPPYIARNSARRRGLPFPKTSYQDTYLHALDLMLKRSDYVAAIVPAAFGTLDLFRDRLTHLIDLPFQDMFSDTNHPVCLSLFEPESAGAMLWAWDRKVGREAHLRRSLPDLPSPAKVVFNVPLGLIGLKAIDTTMGPSIAFVAGGEIDPASVKPSSRSVTRLDVDGVDERNVGALIDAANARLERIRRMTGDVVLTPFKGVRRDGAFRRRLDYRTAKIVLSLALDAIQRQGL